MMRSLFVFIGLLAFIGIMGTLSAEAQSAPQVIINWRTPTFVPREYSGKPLPTAESRIEASVEVLQNGRLADLSKETIYWYVDNRFVSGGAGIQSASFRTPPLAFNPIALRVEIPTWKNGELIKGTSIPVVFPEAVVQSPPKPIRTPFVLRALPYFFNTDFSEILLFEWSVNGERATPAGRPDMLTIQNAPPGAALDISLSIRNPLFDLEGNRKSLTFTMQ